MIRSFKHKGLKLFFETGIASGISGNHADRLNIILTRLNASHSPEDMRLPGLKLHKLRGNFRDYYAVYVSGNWRVTFKFKGDEVVEVDYLDYH